MSATINVYKCIIKIIKTISLIKLRRNLKLIETINANSSKQSTEITLKSLEFELKQ